MTGPARGAPAHDLPAAPCLRFVEPSSAQDTSYCWACGGPRVEHEGRAPAAASPAPSRLPTPEEHAADNGFRGADSTAARLVAARDAAILARLSDVWEALVSGEPHDTLRLLDALRAELRGAS